MKHINNWAVEEVKGADLGNKRLKTRYISLLDSLSKTPSNSIPMACKSWKETIAAYRFFNNDKVRVNNILSSHMEATLERIKKEDVVLIPQDTTQINFSGRKPISGMGYLGTEKSHGFYLHPGLAFTPAGLCLGVVDFQYWVRDKIGMAGDRRQKTIEEKESYCWLKGYQAANQVALACPDTLVISISDREGDIYEVLQNIPSQTNKAFWLIRSNMNRKVLKSPDTRESEDRRESAGTRESADAAVLKLHQRVKSMKPIGEIEFQLSPGRVYANSILEKRIDRQKRVVKQEIRACRVNLSPPHRSKEKLSAIPVNIVHCLEIDPASNQERIERFRSGYKCSEVLFSSLADRNFF